MRTDYENAIHRIEIIERIKGALATFEEGENLIEVVRKIGRASCRERVSKQV